MRQIILDKFGMMEVCANGQVCTQFEHQITSALLLPRREPDIDIFCVTTLHGCLYVYRHDSSSGRAHFELVFSQPSVGTVSYLVCGHVFNDQAPLRHGNCLTVSSVATNGQLHSFFIHPVTGQTRLCFKQRIISNVCAAFVADMHNDGHHQLFVSLSDRILRSYGFVNKNNTCCLMPQGKWETPEQITAVAYASDQDTATVILSQISAHFVRLQWATTDSDDPAINVETLNTEFKAQFDVHDSADSCAFVPWNCHYASLYMNLATRLFLHECGYGVNVQMLLPHGFRVAFLCVVRVTAGSLLMVVTLSGAALVFALFGTFKQYLAKQQQQSEQQCSSLNKPVMMPSARFQLASNLSSCKAAVDAQQRTLNLLVSTTDLYVVLYTIDLRELITRIKHM